MSHLPRFLLLAVCAACAVCAVAQDPRDSAAPSPAGGMGDVVHIAGLTEVKPEIRGTLRITPSEVVFLNASVQAAIPRSRILNVFVGDERTEPWGTKGQIARKVIPFGGGLALGAVTSGQVDLLTIESIDAHGGYHGAVFAVPYQKAAALREQLTAHLSPPTAMTPVSCPDGQQRPRSVLLDRIAVSGATLPDEYRILLYEQLYKQLRTLDGNDSFLRTGDVASGPGCPALTLQVTVVGFKKGNRALRASTGPLGLFLGTTSLTFEINLRDVKGNNVFHAGMKKSDRTDTDSLGLADGIAKSVAKRIDKELGKRAPKAVGEA